MSISGTSEKQQDTYILKKQAMKYYKENNVPVEMENVLNTMFYDKPPDVYGYLVNYFSQFAKPATLNKLSASKVLDSNGHDTIQIDVWCTVNNLAKYVCSSTIPRADMTLNVEDNEKAERHIQASVRAAVKMINKQLSNKFAGVDPLEQETIDSDILSFITLQKETDEPKQTDDLDKVDISDDKHKKSSTKIKLATTTTVRETKGGKESVSLPIVPDRPQETFLVGCEVAAAISQAVCVCAATTRNIPIYQYVAKLTHPEGASNEFRMPIPMVTIIQSGKSVHGKVICIKEFMIVPGTKLPADKGIQHILNIFQHVSKFLLAKQTSMAKLVSQTGALCPQLESVNQALDMLLDAVQASGLTIGEDVHLAINGAGYESFDRDRGRYEVLTGQYKSPDDMVDFWCDIIKKYPSIVAVIDPIRGEDNEQWQNLSERISENVYVIGDTFFERPGLLREMQNPTQTSGMVMHMERMNTITDIIACAKKYQDLNNELVISTNNGDTTDTFIVDLAVGLNARFLKVGGPCRGEKTSKLNRILQILKEMVPQSKPEQVANINETVSVHSNKLVDNDDAKSCRDDMSSTMSMETTQDKKDLAWGERENCYLKPHAPFIFPVIKSSQHEIEVHI